MPAPTRSRSAAPRRSWRALALAAAGLWLFMLGCLAAVQTASAEPQFISPRIAAPASPPTSTGPTSTTTPDPTATDTPSASASPTGTSSVTPSATATKAATATATATSSDNGSGGYGNGGGATPANGAQPTKVVFSQPTGGSPNDSPLQGLSPAAFGSNGLLIAMSMSCLVGVLGLVVAAVAIRVLIRGGYGPFLKALLRGKRAGLPRGKGKGKSASGADDDDGGWGDSRDDWGASQEYSALADSYQQPVRPARAPVGVSRNAGPNAGPVARPRQPTRQRGDRW